MKRSTDETARARYEDELRHQGRSGGSRAAAVRHVSRRHSEDAAMPGSAPDSSSAAPLQPSVASSTATRRPTACTEDAPVRSFERIPAAAGAAPNPPSRGPARSAERSAETDEDSSAARLSQSRQRKAQQKMRMTTMLLVVPTAVASVMLMAMAHVVFRDWRSYESEARIAHAQLGALQEQLDTGQRRLDSLRSPKGREQILVEHGYIRPGDRLLLFPSESTPDEGQAGATQARNDIAARRAIRNTGSSSAWDRAARAMTGWLGGFSRSATNKSASAGASKPKTAPSSEATTGSTPLVSGQVSDDDDGVSPQDRIVSPREDASP